MESALKWNGPAFLRQVEELSGAKVSACLQCHKCSAGCPIAEETDLRSSQIMRLVNYGEEEELLTCNAIWLCASCEACTSRCPMDIDVAAVMDALRIMAVKDKAEIAGPRVELFNRKFLASVERHGRVFETGMMAGYAFQTGELMANMGKATRLFFRGRLSLMPHRSRDKKRVAEIAKKALKEDDR